MFYIATENGFVSNEINYFVNIRKARPFTSFKEADDYAKDACFKWFAVLSTKAD